MPTGERGSIIPLVPVLVIAFFMIGGLIVDGSRELNARGEAQAYAEEAARAGATAVDLKSDTLALDPVIAEARVRAYCAAVMGTNNSPVSSCSLADPAFTDAKTCQGQTAAIVVNAVVQMRIETSLLGIVGITDLTSSGRAKARPFEGTTPGNAC
jgi:Flp pilus assembly protein TadG